MSCRDFELWLDEGMPRETAAAHERHAAGCAACAAGLRAARELEALLASPAVETPAPAGFTDRVLRGLRTPGTGRSPILGWLIGDAFPWWVRAATERRVVLALVLFALVTWRDDLLRVLALAFAVETSRWAGAAFARFFPFADDFARPEVLAGLALALVPLLALGSAALYRWTETLIVYRSVPPSPARRG